MTKAESEKILFKGYCLFNGGKLESANGVAIDVERKAKGYINYPNTDIEKLEYVFQEYMNNPEFEEFDVDNFISNSKFFNPYPVYEVDYGLKPKLKKAVYTEEVCAKCHKRLSEPVVDYCESKSIRPPLCYDCQRGRSKTNWK